jgi:hypothetical protein
VWPSSHITRLSFVHTSNYLHCHAIDSVHLKLFSYLWRFSSVIPSFGASNIASPLSFLSCSPFLKSPFPWNDSKGHENTFHSGRYFRRRSSVGYKVTNNVTRLPRFLKHLKLLRKFMKTSLASKPFDVHFANFSEAPRVPDSQTTITPFPKSD